MLEYRIFTLTKKRHIAGPAEVECASDEQSIEEAKILMNEYDIEYGKVSHCYATFAYV